VDTIVIYAAVLDAREGTVFFVARLLWMRPASWAPAVGGALWLLPAGGTGDPLIPRWRLMPGSL
jgi:hypothetical protein